MGKAEDINTLRARIRKTKTQIAAAKMASEVAGVINKVYMQLPSSTKGCMILTFDGHELTMEKRPERDSCSIYHHMSADEIWVARELPFVSICSAHMAKEALDGNVHEPSE